MPEVVVFTRARLQATAALCGALVLAWRFRGICSISLAMLMGAFALLAWFAPKYHQPVQRAFDLITHWLVAGFTWAILSLVYFCVFTPMRLAGTLMGRDPLGLKPAPQTDPASELDSRQRAAENSRQAAAGGRDVSGVGKSKDGVHRTSRTTYLRPIAAPAEDRFSRQF